MLQQVLVSDEDLVEWFKHVDHVLPHKRVALSELSCAEDGKRPCFCWDCWLLLQLCCY